MARRRNRRHRPGNRQAGLRTLRHHGRRAENNRTTRL